jgi:hypothetical protein
MAAEHTEKRKKKKKRSAAYRIRHNFKRSHRRRLKRHAAATALLREHPYASLVMGSVLSFEQQSALLSPGVARLPRVKQAMERIKQACGNLQHIRTAYQELRSSSPDHKFPAPPRNPSPDQELLARPHRYEKLNAPTRIRYALGGDAPMLKNLFSVGLVSPGGHFNGTLGSYQPCPQCQHETLRIFPAPGDGEFYFRCHGCGTCFKTLEFLRCSDFTLQHNRGSKWLAYEVWRRGYLAEPLSPETLQHYGRLQQWRGSIESGRRQYGEHVHSSQQPRFGDWLALTSFQMQRLVWEGSLLKYTCRQPNLVRVQRNVFGFPCSFALYSNLPVPSAEVRFTNDTFALVTPGWCDFFDWYNDIIVCPDEQMATALERAVTKWPETERAVVATIAETSRPLEGPLPFRNVWLPVRPDQSPGYGLMLLGDGAHKLLVTRFRQLDPELKNLENITKQELCPAKAQQCLDVVTEEIANDSRDVQLVLNETLAEPHVGERAGRAVVARVAQLRGIPVEELANMVELRSNPFCFRLNGALYCVRDGQFWKKKKRDREFGPITNFALRVEYSRPHRAGNNILDVVLMSQGRQVHFGMTELEFNNSNRLWRAVRMAAASAGLPYPLMTTVPERRLLPELVRGSHAWFPVPPRHRSLIVKTVLP